MERAKTVWKDGDANKMLDLLFERQKDERELQEKRSFMKGKSQVQVAQNLGLQKVKQCKSQITLLDGGCNKSYTYNQTRGLRYLTGSGEGYSQFESERGLTDVLGVQVQREGELHCVSTFLLEPESIAILQSNEVRSQSNHREVQCESGSIFEQYTNFITGNGADGALHSYNNSIHEGAGLKDVDSKIQGNTNVILSIPWLEMEDQYHESIRSSGQEMVIELEDEKMDSVCDGQEGSGGQEVIIAARRIKLFEDLDKERIFNIWIIICKIQVFKQ
ncbi:MAG: hypothetical protein EZS28_050163 [Streblomastix strix]|uniref:Uncharacterized protein n=1 Tax=Streblomastix strix TaxID=222440 RepID=A0A5J4T9T7_9EUKA|nr:MAG: hypothetical protein EZS28_050163 [Streblomastix strix]